MAYQYRLNQPTGQYSNMGDFGLMFYNARWLRSVPATPRRGYDPSLGRFVQADTIIPGGVQGLDRYAYVNNDPIRYTDPSGHIISCEADEDCKEVRRTDKLTFNQAYKEAFAKFRIKVSDKFTRDDKIAILLGISAAGTKAASERGENETASEAFQEAYGSIELIKVHNFEYQGGTYDAGCKTEGSAITCARITGGGIRFQSSINNIVHEIGHVFDSGSGIPGVFVDNRDDILHNNDTVMWQSNTAYTPTETFGDFFVAWVFDTWGPKADDVWKENPSVGSARHWMTTSMSEWLQP